MAAVKLIGIGDGVGVVLPRDMVEKLGLKEGDMLQAADRPDGVTLTVTDPEFEAQLEVARRVMRKRRVLLRELAK
jgi:putative addiction module antidote